MQESVEKWIAWLEEYFDFAKRKQKISGVFEDVFGFPPQKVEINANRAVASAIFSYFPSKPEVRERFGAFFGESVVESAFSVNAIFKVIEDKNEAETEWVISFSWDEITATKKGKDYFAVFTLRTEMDC
ncbi:MAG: hypothetical protein B6U97_03515 [Candidatus Altiarchaeales archaeon ex4484_96]|nr:MAG: hypothetical protein B6U97_03515 [Candidatus Altiarchaeales archaeon ex4484_96]